MGVGWLGIKYLYVRRPYIHTNTPTLKYLCIMYVQVYPMSFMSPEILSGGRGALVMAAKVLPTTCSFGIMVAYHITLCVRKGLGGENEKEKETRDTHENQLAPTMVLR